MKLINYFLGLLLLIAFTKVEVQGQSKGRNYKLTFEKAFVQSNNHVGNDWLTYLKIGNQVLKEGEHMTIKLIKRAPVKMVVEAIEEDQHYNDTGSESLELTYSEMIAIEKNRFEIVVEVVENGGQYEGNIAVLKFLVGVEQITGD